MNAAETVREIQRRTPLPPERRATHGSWVEARRAVLQLVDAGWGVSDAVHRVVGLHNFHPPEKAFRSIRAGYYVLRAKLDGGRGA